MTPARSPSDTDNEALRITAVGDIMLGRGLSGGAATRLSRLLPPHLTPTLAGDLVTGNLECTLATGLQPSRFAHHAFHADPESAKSVLRHFHVVNLANNHLGDFGATGARHTMKALTAMNIKYVGAGASRQEAYQPVILARRRLTVAIFGATHMLTVPPRHGLHCATFGRRLWSAIAAAKKKGADVVIAHLHLGGGDFAHPAPWVRVTMQRALAAGADIVLGHHPHIVQGWQQCERGVIFYSLGDFVFDRTAGHRRYGLVAKISWSPASTKVAVQPVQRSPECRLSLLSGPRARQFAQHLQQLNAALHGRQTDELYRRWYGSPLRRLWASAAQDFKHGGAAALWKKMLRLLNRPFTM